MKLSWEAIGKHFPGRSAKSIQHKACALGLRKGINIQVSFDAAEELMFLEAVAAQKD